MAQKPKAQDGSRFIKLVVPEHVEKVNAWCEYTQTKSAPKAIAKAIDMAMQYEHEVPELKDRVRMLEMAIRERSLFFSGVRGEDADNK